MFRLFVRLLAPVLDRTVSVGVDDRPPDSYRFGRRAPGFTPRSVRCR